MTDETLRIQKLLSDIDKSAKRILERMEGVTKDCLSQETSMDIQDIVIRRLSIIGEASARLLKKHPDFCKQNPQIPLHEARGLKNVIVHDYDGIKWHVIWNTIHTNLPPLIKAIEPLLSEEK